MNTLMRFTRTGLPVVLFFFVLCSGISLPILKQHKRDRLNELYDQVEVRDKLEAEWSRLLLEQATLIAPSRIEQLAQTQLHLRIPKHRQVRELTP